MYILYMHQKERFNTRSPSRRTFEPDEKTARVLRAVEKEMEKVFRERLKKIILFGSYSRGDFDENSDIDVMVLTDAPNPDRYDDLLLDVEVDLSLAFDVVLSLFAENSASYEEARQYKPFLKAVHNEGIEIYAA